MAVIPRNNGLPDRRRIGIDGEVSVKVDVIPVASSIGITACCQVSLYLVSPIGIQQGNDGDSHARYRALDETVQQLE